MSWFKLISIKYIINKVKANLIFYLYIHNQTDIFLISKILNLIFFLFFFLLFLRIFWSRMSERKADKGHTYSVIHLLSSVDKCLSAIYQLKPINGRLTTPFNLQSINNSQSFFSLNCHLSTNQQMCFSRLSISCQATINFQIVKDYPLTTYQLSISHLSINIYQ